MMQLMLAASAAQTPAPPGFSDLDRTVRAEMLETRTPGVALIVISKDRVVFQSGYGVISIDNPEPVTMDTLFQIGSITKMFTAATLLTLTESGRVTLDQKVGKRVEGLSPKLALLTARQLLSQTAGLKDEPDEYGSHDESALSDYVRSWKDDYCLFEPGRAFSYSNAGFALAGLFVQEAAGRPFADQVTDAIFKPLGMIRSTFKPTMAMTHPLAVGHRARPGDPPVTVRPAADDSRLWPAGGMYSNAGELARFAIAFVNGGRLEGKQVISPSVIGMMMKPVAEIPGQQQSYGLGVFVYDHRGVRVVEHEGSMPGFFGLLRMVPDKRFAVIILSNLESGILRKTAEKAMESVLSLQPAVDRSAQTALSISKSEMESLAGAYWQPNRWTIELFIKEGKLYLRQFGFEMPVTKIGAHRFSVTRPGAPAGQEFEMINDIDGRPDLLQMFVWTFKRK